MPHLSSQKRLPVRFCCREEGGLQPLDDTFVLDTTANEWRWPEEGSGSGGKPAARNAGTMNLVGGGPESGGQLLLHGGWKPFVVTWNDSWLLPLDA